MNAIDEIKVWKEKAANYDRLKEEFDRFKSDVKKAMSDINSVLSIDPANIRTRGKSILPDIAKILSERAKEKDGYQIDRKEIEAELNMHGVVIGNNTVFQVYTQLRKIPFLEETKNGFDIRFFYSKRKEENLKIGKVNIMG